jgi:hypothetical protein
MGKVCVLQTFPLVIRQRHLDRAHCIDRMLHARRADDGSGHSRASQQPRKSDLRRRNSALRRDGLHDVDDVEVPSMPVKSL